MFKRHRDGVQMPNMSQVLQLGTQVLSALPQ